jgi:hypothetical protein
MLNNYKTGRGHGNKSFIIFAEEMFYVNLQRNSEFA